MSRRQTFDLGTVPVSGYSEEVDLSSFTSAVAYVSPTYSVGRPAFNITVVWEFSPTPMGEAAEWYQQFSHSLSVGQYTIVSGEISSCIINVPDSTIPRDTKLAIDCPYTGVGTANEWTGAKTIDPKVPRRARLSYLSCSGSNPLTDIAVSIEAHQRRS